MQKVNIHEAKTNLSSLILKVEKSREPIRICRDGEAVAELRPLPRKRNPLRLNSKLKVKFIESPVSPLDPDDWSEID